MLWGGTLSVSGKTASLCEGTTQLYVSGLWVLHQCVLCLWQRAGTQNTFTEQIDANMHLYRANYWGPLLIWGNIVNKLEGQYKRVVEDFNNQNNRKK